MRTHFMAGLLVAILLTTGSQANADLMDYGLYGLSPTGGPSAHTDLLLIDPSDASFSVVATFDIELDSFEIMSDGRIFATGTYGPGGPDPNLYLLDPDSGSYSIVGTVGTGVYFHAMASDANGTLYASDVLNNELYTVDTNTGTPTLVGSLNGPDNLAGLGFTGDDSVLYGVEYDSSGGDFYTVDRLTGGLTFIGTSEVRLHALAVDPLTGVVYASRNSPTGGLETLVFISPLDGTPTTIGSMNVGTLTGLSYFNPAIVPEPSCISFLAAALAWITTRRRRGSTKLS